MAEMTLEEAIRYARGYVAMSDMEDTICQAFATLLSAARRLDGDLALAKSCFLGMIADAHKWEVDVDGDTDDAGRPVYSVTYKLEVDGFSFEQLPEALGIKPRYMETMEDAIAREIDAPPVIILPAEEPAGE